MRDVFKCLGIQLDEDCLTVVDKNAINVKSEQGVDDDMLWEDPLEEKSVSMDDEFTSDVPLTIDLGESSMSNIDVYNTFVQDENQHEGQSLLVGIKTSHFL